MNIPREQPVDQIRQLYEQKTGLHVWQGTARAILGILITLLLCIGIPAAAVDNEGATTNPTVIIADYQVTPAVLLPGDQGTITLTLKNTAQSASVKENTGITSGGMFANTRSTDINVYVEKVHIEGNGISVVTESFDRLGEIGPGQSVPVTFVIRAPDKSGIYFPEAWIDVKNGRSTRYPLTVNVNTDISTQKKPSLAIARTLPAQVVPGEDIMVNLSLGNNGLTRASDIVLVANSTQKSIALASTGRYYVDHLEPGDNAAINLRLTSDKNAPIGICPVSLILTYHNPDGTTERQTETIGIPFKGKADIAVSSVTTDPVRPNAGSPFSVIVRVENTGTDRATSVRATIDAKLAGTRDAFIGSINKDSDAPAVFYVQAADSGTVPMTIHVTYTDDYGTHSINETTTIMTNGPGPLSPVLVLLIIGALAGAISYWYFRIRPGCGHAQ
ncbi:MAG: S-layer protein [Methanomicrobiales archaeon]|nr:S-layer protein [Methanomicrobiales archaeon]